MKKLDFLAKVKEEVAKLKSVLTAEETAKLDYLKFKPFNSDLCLLGQLTDNAYSDRAKEILPKDVRAAFSIPQIYGFFGAPDDFRIGFDDIKFRELNENEEFNITALELFLMLDSNSEDVFKYLKGEIEAFEPNFNEVAVEA